MNTLLIALAFLLAIALCLCLFGFYLELRELRRALERGSWAASQFYGNATRLMTETHDELKRLIADRRS